MLNIAAKIAAELDVSVGQIERTIALFDEDNTIPFVARYRKEVTGGLDEIQLRTIHERLDALRKLTERQATILKSIEEQGQLTPALAAKINAAETMQALEDLYLPYRPKRRTRATIARERGLAPLAESLLLQAPQSKPPEQLATTYLNDDVPDVEAALAGARDIIAEQVADNAEVRSNVRTFTQRTALLVSKATKKVAEVDPKGVYEMYYDYQEALPKVAPHRLLAINRGERDGALKVKLVVDDDRVVRGIEAGVIQRPRSHTAAQLRLAVADSYKRLITPAIHREVRRDQTTHADDHAIRSFGVNLRNLLLQPPLKGKRVLGIDPGFRTGCKVVVVDETGKFLGGATIYPHPPQKQWDAARDTLLKLMRKTGATVLAVGNGTAGRETETLAAEVVAAVPDSAYTIVNEAGASVYSASPLAVKEFPDLDVSMRGAVSIARRLQDPLAELVKIDPKSIGVGLYQHDVDQKQLEGALDAVVESVVNNVGVDVNTASPALLKYTAGVSRKIAGAIVAHRDTHGPFAGRKSLLKVKGLGAKTFEQAAGFLKVPAGKNPLDNTIIHPESYPVAEKVLAQAGTTQPGPALAQQVQTYKRLPKSRFEHMARSLGVGPLTLVDILDALAQPGRDPRDDLPPPVLRADVLSMADLQPGMMLKGTVRNVVAFGAFVDIGVKQDGLVHISQLADRFVEDPHQIVGVGDVVQVRVLSVDTDRDRIALSMRRE